MNRTRCKPHRNYTLAAIFVLSTVAVLTPVQAQDDSQKPKREPQPARQTPRPQEERRSAEAPRSIRGGENPGLPVPRREMARLQERVADLDRRLDQLTQRIDRMRERGARALRFRQGEWPRPGVPGPRPLSSMDFEGRQATGFPERPQQPPMMSRLAHLQAAIDNLRAAGMPEAAERLARELERMRAERRGELDVPRKKAAQFPEGSSLEHADGPPR